MRPDSRPITMPVKVCSASGAVTPLQVSPTASASCTMASQAVVETSGSELRTPTLSAYTAMARDCWE
eukprot:10592473-Lingulodinium_polyedra.AAC.1